MAVKAENAPCAANRYQLNLTALTGFEPHSGARGELSKRRRLSNGRRTGGIVCSCPGNMNRPTVRGINTAATIMVPLVLCAQLCEKTARAVVAAAAARSIPACGAKRDIHTYIHTYTSGSKA